MADLYDISVPKFSDYNPRSDTKNNSWFRLNNNWAQRLLKQGLSWSEVSIWPLILGEISDQTEKSLVLDITTFCKMHGVRKKSFVSCFTKLKDLGIVDGGPRTLRARNADVALRTNVTNVTNERTLAEGSSVPPAPPKKRAKAKPKPPGEKTPTAQIWNSYSDAYLERYKNRPPTSSQGYGIAKQILQRVGVEDGKAVVRFYLTHNKRYYVEKVHMLKPCLADVEGLVQQMKSNTRITSAKANQADKSQANQQVFENAFAKLRDKQVIKAVDVGDA